jgi:hypothetical protein
MSWVKGYDNYNLYGLNGSYMVDGWLRLQCLVVRDYRCKRLGFKYHRWYGLRVIRVGAIMC